MSLWKWEEVQEVSRSLKYMKIIKQSTYESCLPCCLLMLTGKSNKDEIKIWKSGWKFDYLIGQLNFVSAKYKRQFDVYVENKYYFNEFEAVKNSNIKLINKKIDLKLLDSLLKYGQVIIYLDNYYLQKIVHAPHFILALSSDSKHIKVADPFDGKLKQLPRDLLNKGIISLRNHLKFSPVLVCLKKSSS